MSPPSQRLEASGGTGIGLMIAQTLAANGAKVCITSRREEVLQKTEKLHDHSNSEIVSLVGDASDPKDVKRLYKEISEKEPLGIQLLVNNAGIARDDKTKFSNAGEPEWEDAQSISDHFLKSPSESSVDMFKTNVGSIFYMSMTFLPLLAKGGKKTPGYTSSVINVTSISGAMKGSSSGRFGYASSRASATHLSKILATTFVKTKIRVNVIVPGVFPSEMTTGSSNEDNKSAIEGDMSNPAGRPGKDSDMAASVLLLAEAGGVLYNDQILYPDGGNTLTQPSSKT